MIKMKHILALTIVGVLAGCASVGSYQEQCEIQHAAFSDMVRCLKTTISSNSRAAEDARVKLYLLKAEQLSQQVQKGEIGELDARVSLQELYVLLKRDENAEAGNAIASMPKTKTTRCTTGLGNSIRCTTR